MEKRGRMVKVGEVGMEGEGEKVCLCSLLPYHLVPVDIQRWGWRWTLFRFGLFPSVTEQFWLFPSMPLQALPKFVLLFFCHLSNPPTGQVDLSYYHGNVCRSCQCLQISCPGDIMGNLFSYAWLVFMITLPFGLSMLLQSYIFFISFITKILLDKHNFTFICL